MALTHQLYISFDDVDTADNARTWVDKSSSLVSFDIRGGRDSELGSFDSITGTYVLQDTDRELDPTNASSTHYPNVVPNRMLWHRITDGTSVYDVFKGYVDGWGPTPVSAGSGQQARVRVTEKRKLLVTSSFDSASPDVLDYEDVVTADQPTFYYRLGEPEGTKLVHHVRKQRKTKVGGAHGAFIVKKHWTSRKTRAEVEGVSGPAGSYKNTPTLGEPGAIAGDPDTCVKFTRASTEYARIALDNAEDFTVEALTLEAWVKPASLASGAGNENRVISGPKNSGIGGSVAFLSLASGVTAFSVPDGIGGGVNCSGPGLTLNEWAHIVGTKDSSGNMSLYINGVQVGTDTTAGAALPDDASLFLYIGSSNENLSTKAFDGWIDEPAFYQKELSADRVLAHYEAGRLGFDSKTTGGRIMDVLQLARPSEYDSLTLSGNEVTDTVRATGTSGDMRPIRAPVFEADCETCDQTTLSGAMTNVQTTIPLTALPARWPTNSAFRIMVDKETILVKPDGTLNPPCVRGVAQRWGSAQAAAAHSSGAVVSNFFDGWMLGVIASKAYSLGGIPSDQVAVVSSPVRTGNRAWKCTVRPGDYDNAADTTRERFEFSRTLLGELGERWYHAWSTYLPVGYAANDTSPGAYVMQLSPDYGSGSPAMSMRRDTTTGQWRLVFNTGFSATRVGTYTAQHNLADATEGVWHDFLLYVDWQVTNTGVVKVWHREQGSAWGLVADLSGIPTSQEFDGAPPTPSVFRRHGIYRTADAVKTNYLYHDAIRASQVKDDVSVDPLSSPDGTTGIWGGTTNLLANDTFTAAGTATITNDSAKPLFGVSSKRVDFLATSDYVHRTFSGLTVGQTYTASLWVYRSEVDARLLTFAVRNAANSADVATSNCKAVTGWQRVSATWTAAETSGRIRLILTDTVNKPIRVWLGASQVENLALPTPYVVAGTTRGAARVRVPVTNLDETQGWLAMVVRNGMASTEAGDRTLALWADDSTHRLVMYWDATADAWKFGRGNGTVLTASQADVFTRGVTSLVIGRWTSTNVSVSVDGGAFTSTAQSSIPSLSATLVDLGSNGSASHLNGDVIWAAWGKGTFTDADAEQLYELGPWNGAFSDKSGFSAWNGWTGLASSWNIQIGQRTMPPARYAGLPPIDLVNDAVGAEGEPAAFFYSREGNPTFLDSTYRDRAPYSSSRVNFGNGSGQVQFEDAGLAPDDAFLYNDIRGTNEEGTQTFSASDPASIDRFGHYVLTLDSLPIANDSDTQSYVDDMLARFKDPMVRVPSFRLNATDATSAAWLLKLDIGDQVTVNVPDAKTGGVLLSQSSYVELRGISQSDKSAPLVGEFSISPR